MSGLLDQISTQYDVDVGDADHDIAVGVSTARMDELDETVAEVEDPR